MLSISISTERKLRRSSAEYFLRYPQDRPHFCIVFLPSLAYLSSAPTCIRWNLHKPEIVTVCPRRPGPMPRPFPSKRNRLKLVSSWSTTSGGPVIDMKYGRKDATTPQCCVDEGNLPAGNAPFPNADTPQVCRGFTAYAGGHLERHVFIFGCWQRRWSRLVWFGFTFLKRSLCMYIATIPGCCFRRWARRVLLSLADTWRRRPTLGGAEVCVGRYSILRANFPYRPRHHLKTHELRLLLLSSRYKPFRSLLSIGYLHESVQIQP